MIPHLPIAPMYNVTVTKARDKGTIKEGETQSHPIYEGYTIKGRTQFLPAIGERWIVARHERNGDSVLGIFTTTEVTRVYHNENTRTVLFETENSCYLVNYTLDTDDPDVLRSEP